MPQHIDLAFEREPLHFEDGTSVNLAKQAAKRWVAGRAVYELASGGYVLVEHIEGKAVTAAKLDDYHALKILIDLDAELSPKLQELLDAGEWRKWKKPLRDLSHWGGRGLLKSEPRFSAHEVAVTDLLKEIVRAGIVLVQLLRGQLDKTGKWEAEIRGEFIGALFDLYAVDPDRWWGSEAVIPPASVGILDLLWPNGSEDLRATVTELQALTEPPLACIAFSGRRIDNPKAPTHEEQELALTALHDRAPQIEALIVKLRKQLAELTAPEAIERMREAGIIKVPPESAVLAYCLYKFLGYPQTDVAARVGHATGGTTSQGTVSRWIKEVGKWLERNALPPISAEVMCRAFAADPKRLDMGWRVDLHTQRQRAESDDL